MKNKWIPKWEKSFQGGVIKIANTPEQIYSNRGLLIMLLIVLLIRADVTYVSKSAHRAKSSFVIIEICDIH